MGLTEVPLRRQDRDLLATMPEGSRMTRYDDGTPFGRVLVNNAEGPTFWLVMRDTGCGLFVDVVDVDGEVTATGAVR